MFLLLYNFFYNIICTFRLFPNYSSLCAVIALTDEISNIQSTERISSLHCSV